MKRFLTAAVLFLIAAVYAGEMVKSENLAGDEKGMLCPFRQFTPFFELDFGKDPAIWNRAFTRNYRNLVIINVQGTKFDQKCLLVTRTNPAKERDTAWSVGTKPFAYTGKPGPVIITVEAASSVNIGKARPEGYRNDIEWLDANGKKLGITTLKYSGISREFTSSRCSGIVPNGTKRFIIRVGFDYPNIDRGTFCAIKSLKIASDAANVPYMKNAFFETVPFENSGRTLVSWKADAPAGSRITVAASTAEIRNDIPQPWSAFGPEQDKPFYVTAPWIRFRVTYHNSGTACPVLKEFKIGKQAETGWFLRMNLRAPIVENKTVSPTRNAKTDVVLRVVSTAPVVWKSLKVSVDGKDVTGKVIRKGDLLTLKAEKDYAPGKHTVKVSIANTGASQEYTKYFLIGDGPSVPKITIRDDGMTLVDGKPFFPIGFYAVWKREFNKFDFDKCMKDLHEAGVNFVHTYNGINSPDAEKFFAAGRKYGMKFWVQMWEPGSKSFEKHTKNPDILAWYIGDDTSYYLTPAVLQDRNDHLRALDDKRITTQADGVGAEKGISNYRDYVLGSDNFLPEIYPVRKDTDEDKNSSVAAVIRDMKLCQQDLAVSKTDRPRNFWSIIQYFLGWGSWRRFPEENEIRAMSFASIIHGATGITWYTYGGYFDKRSNRYNYGVTSTPERWRIITTITKQLNQLIPVLTERSPKDQPQVTVLSGPVKDVYGNPSVTCLLKRHDGKNYIFAVNAVRRNVKAQIRLPGLGSGKVLFENRDCTVKNGVLTDEFKPYDVHIYELEKARFLGLF